MAAQGVWPWMLSGVVLLLCIPEAQTAEKSKSYYDTLNVQRSATTKQIKKAFHRQAMMYHPDKNKSADAEKLFRAAAEAYEVLSNKEKRKLYDQLSHEDFQENESFPHPEPSFHFDFDFDDLFTADFDDENDEMFTEGPHSHWSFFDGDEGEEGTFERYSFPGQDSFGPADSFFVDENEEEFFY